MEFKEEWFLEIFDAIEKIERQTEEQKEFLKIEKQLDIETKELNRAILAGDSVSAYRALERRDERMMMIYNTMLKNIVLAIEFKNL
jgi:predicted metal-dependent hydrolase